MNKISAETRAKLERLEADQLKAREQYLSPKAYIGIDPDDYDIACAQSTKLNSVFKSLEVGHVILVFEVIDGREMISGRSCLVVVTKIDPNKEKTHISPLSIVKRRH